MRTESLAAFADVNRAASAIKEGLRQSTPEVFETDAILQAAVERFLMIIGEALVRIRTFEPDLLTRITDSHKIIGLRNVLVHGYDRIDASEVWRFAHQNLPVLAEEVDRLLNG